MYKRILYFFLYSISVTFLSLSSTYAAEGDNTEGEADSHDQEATSSELVINEEELPEATESSNGNKEARQTELETLLQHVDSMPIELQREMLDPLLLPVQEKLEQFLNPINGGCKQELRCQIGTKGRVFSPDGKILAVGLDLWDTETGAKRYTLEGHNGIPSVHFSPNGEILASASPGILALWNVETGKKLYSVKKKNEIYGAINFSLDSKKLIFTTHKRGARPNYVNIWDIEEEKKLHRFIISNLNTILPRIYLSPDGKTLTVLDSEEMTLWDVETATELFFRRKIRFSKACAHQGRGIIASCSKDGYIQIWDIETATELQTMKSYATFPVGLSFNGDGTQLAASTVDGVLKLWDVDTGIQLYSNRIKEVFSLNFIKGHLIASQLKGDGNVVLWDGETGEFLQLIEGNGRNCPGYFNAERNICAVNSKMRTIKLVRLYNCSERLYLRAVLNHLKQYLSPSQIVLLYVLNRQPAKTIHLVELENFLKKRYGENPPALLNLKQSYDSLDPLVKELVADCFHVGLKSEADSNHQESRTTEEKPLPIENKVRENKISPFEKEKMRFYAKVAKACFALEKGRYHHILKKVKKLLGAALSKLTAEEGDSRVDAGIRILNELVEIHMMDEYGSPSKRERLHCLVQRATDVLELMDDDERTEISEAVPKLNPKELRYEVRIFYSLLNKMHAKSKSKCIGGNVGLNFINLGLGIGGVVGSSRTPLGERHIALFLQPFIAENSLQFGPSLMAGYYDFEVSRHKKVLSCGINSGVKGESLLCMSLGNQDNAQFVEVGFTPGYCSKKEIGFYGFELLRLPTDMKYFRKKLSLVASSGVLPSSLVEVINQAKTTGDLRKIDIENYLQHE